jgi:hypothetical protein
VAPTSDPYLWAPPCELVGLQDYPTLAMINEFDLASRHEQVEERVAEDAVRVVGIEGRQR